MGWVGGGGAIGFGGKDLKGLVKGFVRGLGGEWAVRGATGAGRRGGGCWRWYGGRGAAAGRGRRWGRRGGGVGTTVTNPGAVAWVRVTWATPALTPPDTPNEPPTGNTNEWPGPSLRSAGTTTTGDGARQRRARNAVAVAVEP